MPHPRCAMSLVLLLACTPAKVELRPEVDLDEPTGPTVPDYDALCPSTAREADEIVSWAADGDALSFVRMEGSVAPAHTFFGAHPSGTVAVAATARADLIVASATWYAGVWPDIELATELAAFDRAGSLLWTHEEEDVYASLVYQGEDGTVAWDRGYLDFDAANPHVPGLAFTADGTATELAGWPVAPPIDGAVPTCDGSTCGWQDASGAAIGPERVDFVLWRVGVGDHILEPDLYGRTVGIRSEGPGDSVFIPVDGASRLDDVELLDVEGPFALLRAEGHLFRFDADRSTLTPFDLVPPEGLRLFEDSDYCPARPPGLDEAGDLLVALRTDATGSLWHTDLAGSTWEPVGDAVTDVLWLSGEATGATTVLSAISAGETYCQEIPWSGDSEAHPGSWTQLVRGDVIVSLDSAILPAWGTVSLSEDGACALLPDGDGVAVFDIERESYAPVVAAGGWLLDR
jgi:hypothetical protein